MSAANPIVAAPSVENSEGAGPVAASGGIALEISTEDLSLLLTALDHLVKAGGLNAAQRVLPLAQRLAAQQAPAAPEG